ncbi:class I SAM-dependent methyltransferase [Mycolicibacterium fluoranthenivorans]|uniref:Class I SAM-dependent methyltransferase n=1 Tax=Mycolicibacterium fluoranthenivorans TaxID=258505 RepID=A0A7G8P7P0_9MYCO|nr:class I SAM-dependent methyltransferase [Mycolicibacterium fluoranthenivorans]QNJ90356.1 class I SAM-dependent methyltransferase [Mycolicibacterium fluoranthenivorans]
MPGIAQRIDQLKWNLWGARHFRTSQDYWEMRYRHGGNSGAGSYDRLARFKATFLNDFVAVNHISSVIEFGSGAGSQLALATYREYVGVDVSETALAGTRRRFADNPSIRFLHTSEVTDRDRAELSLSLDVIYHLVEDAVFDTYMSRLFSAATRFVVVYASDEDRTWSSPHVRHRNFTQWVKEHQPDFDFVERVQNPYPYSEDDPDNTSFCDFFVFTRSV